MIQRENPGNQKTEAFFAAGAEIKPISPETRVELGDALIELFGSLNDFMLKFASRPPESKSRAAELLNNENLRGKWTKAPALDAIQTIVITAISAFDHGVQLGYSLSNGKGVSSLATISRGCIEAMARAYWLIKPDHPQDTVIRLLSGLHAELSQRHRLDPESHVIDANGRQITISEPISQIEQQLKQLGRKTPLEISYTKLATEFLSCASPNARLLYSQFSGVAHAEQISLWEYVGSQEHTARLNWHLNLEGGLGVSEMVYYPLGFFMRELLQWAGIDTPKKNSWTRLHDDFRDILLKWRSAQ